MINSKVYYYSLAVVIYSALQLWVVAYTQRRYLDEITRFSYHNWSKYGKLH